MEDGQNPQGDPATIPPQGDPATQENINTPSDLEQQLKIQKERNARVQRLLHFELHDFSHGILGKIPNRVSDW